MSSTSTENTFSLYKISSHEPLDGLKRSKCKKCGKSRMFFCYICHSYVDTIDTSKLPTVKLPWKVDIIKHAKEVDGKSTAIHAALLAPDDVKIYTYPTIPDYSKISKVLLVFPGKNACTLEEIFRKSNKRHGCEGDVKDTCASKKAKTETPEVAISIKDETVSKENGEHKADSKSNIETSQLQSFTKIVFIDCTWSQAYSIFRDERVSHLKTVKLGDLQTVYWRHNQDMPFTYLATIEAIFSFFKITHELLNGSYEGQYDNLLYFFSYFYKMVRKSNSKKISMI